jgi:hypothetical protein
MMTLMSGKEGPRFPRLNKEEVDFFNSLDFRLKLPETLLKLEREELGRTIGAFYDYGDEEEDEFDPPEKVGYVLPLKKDNTQHLMITGVGDILIMEPTPFKGRGKLSIEEYKKAFSPNEFDYNIGLPELESDIQPASMVIQHLRNVVNVKNINNTPEQLGVFTKSFKKALSTAFELKAEKEYAKNKTVASFITIFEESFKDLSKSEEPPQDVPPNPAGR